MKGKKLVFAVILSLIVCLLLVPSAYAEEQPTENNSEEEIVVNNNPTNPDGDNGGSDNDSQNNESTDKPADSADSESKNDSDNDSTSDDEGQSGVNDGSSDESENNTTSDDTDTDTDTDKSDNDTASEEEESNTDSEEKEQENASEEETETDTAPSNPGDSNLPPQPEIKRFQVELTYNDKVYKMDGLKGGESHDLAEIIKELGIEGEIESAIGDADDLFDAAQGEDGWKLNTKAAFNTKQKLVLVVNGVEYEIKVTDANVETVDTVDGLINAINGDAQTIIIGSNFDIDKTVEIKSNKVITIDLNGKTLTSKSSKGILNYGKFTLVDNSADKTGKIVNVTVGAYSIINAGVATLNGGTVESSINNRLICNLGTMVINDGFTMDKKDGGWAPVQNGWGNTGHLADVAYYGNTPATLTVNGGTFKVPNGSNAIKNDDCGTLIINGGTFNTRDYTLQNSGKKLTINGGNFTCGDNSVVYEYAGDKTSKSNTAELEINGGNFTTKNLIKFGSCKEVDIIIKGGTFADNKVLNYVPDNAVIVEENGKILVNPKAKEAPANTITLTNDAPVIKYWVVEGKDQTWTKSGNESIVFTLNSSAVTKVLVDGVEVEFELDEDGKIVISAEVLEALEAGEHTVEFIFADGNCKTNIIIK